jgi:hypothetical protein
MYNNQFLLKSINPQSSVPGPTPRDRVPTSLVLAEHLPSKSKLIVRQNRAFSNVTIVILLQGVLQRDALANLHQARLRQLRHELDSPEEGQSVVIGEQEDDENNKSGETAENVSLESQEYQPGTPQTPTSSRFGTLADELRKRRLSLPFGMVRTTQPTTWREPQPFEVLRAVENKDIMYLMASSVYYSLYEASVLTYR